ncbi:aminotransferase class IV family protein [Frigidibacter sp.]|uniref:aminotransferase class IV family protein n=1 Tax=Frigidibacter sp. TaxID=2586418 RepID=UPI003523CB8C
MESPFRPTDLTPDLRLIETLGWDGRRLVRLDRHLDRLASSAARLGFDHDPEAVAKALATITGPAPLRVRLTLAQDGRAEVTHAPLAPHPALWRVALAQTRLDAADPWLGIKTTRRQLYDRDRAALPSGTDEYIYANQYGELCEGTITTLFFDLGSGLCTPPQRCGLLPGCLRAEMLQTGAAREAVLTLADLPRARLWMGNSLRGLIPAAL